MRKATKRVHGQPAPKRMRELKTLRAMPDSQIDYSDAPAAPPAVWRDAVVGKFYRPIKQQLTLRIDADVIDWFRKQGRGYQTRINELLREAMTKESQH